MLASTVSIATEKLAVGSRSFLPGDRTSILQLLLEREMCKPTWLEGRRARTSRRVCAFEVLCTNGGDPVQF